MLARRTLAMCLLVVVTGCSLLTSLSGFSGGTEPSGDAAASDADATTDAATDAATDDGAGAPPNLVETGDFEDPTVTECGPPWMGFQGTLDRTSEAHSGTGACKVCGSPGAAVYTIDGFEVAGPKIGETYVASAWVRAAPGSPSAGRFVLHIRLRRGGVLADGAKPADVSLTSTWQRVEVKLELSDTPDALNVYGAANDAAAGSCFLIDDIALVRVP
jgi:hypothetical protein